MLQVHEKKSKDVAAKDTAVREFEFILKLGLFRVWVDNLPKKIDPRLLFA